VVIEFLDEDSPVKLPFKSVLEHAIFKYFLLGGMPPDPPSFVMLVVLCTTYIQAQASC